MEKKEADFISICPVLNCPNSQKPFVWTHFECGGKEKIDSFGYIRCCKCGEKGKVIDWNFDCTRHEHKANSSIGKSLSLVVCSYISNKEFVSTLIFEITKQLRNQPYDDSQEQQQQEQEQKQDQEQQQQKKQKQDQEEDQQPQKKLEDLPSILRDDTPQPSQKEQIERIELICPCPCKECKRKQNNKEIKWKHQLCKGNLYLNTECYVNCERCGIKSTLASFIFDCKTENAKEEFGSVNYDMGTYLSMFSQIKALQTKDEFLSKLISAIFTQISP